MKDSEVIEFGPVRTIGLSLIAKPQDPRIPMLWREDLSQRANEVQMPEGARAFGICRGTPRAGEGEFEYVATFEATDEAPVPDGMTEVVIPNGSYYVVRAADLSEVGKAWGRVHSEASQKEGWEIYYGPEGWENAEIPSFEVYPHEFPQQTEFFILVPVRRVG